MKSPFKWLVGTAAVVFWIFAFGFILFAADVMRAPEATGRRADAIIVLTGGQLRIKAGLNLLEKGRAKRLLITGVNRRTTKADIARIAGGDTQNLNCCVDLGYEALNTKGNADEAGAWAEQQGFKSLIVVTASYHMPRSLMEFNSRMPDIEIIPHPVIPIRFRNSAWWLDLRTSRVLLSEYIKLFPAALRVVAVRAFLSGARAPGNSAAAHSTGTM